MSNYKAVGNFFIIFEKSETYVIAANYESTISKDKALKNALSEAGCNGTVELDMLLKTGTSKNRFGTINFDGTKFVRNSSKIVEEVTAIKRVTSIFFKEHTDLFKNCILTETQITSVIH
ncbi:MAG: hypothetical protein GQ474_02955 [Sulfurimonas sp.]|nr:hypothetical protein [Sulfurimonas sp.]